jgi:hypothetical protein
LQWVNLTQSNPFSRWPPTCLTFSDSFVFPGTTQGSHRSPDWGISWTEINNGPLDLNRWSILVHDQRIFAWTIDGVAASTNNRSSWQTVLDTSRTGWLGALSLGSFIYAGTWYGKILRSTDEGSAWTLVWLSGPAVP